MPRIPRRVRKEIPISQNVELGNDFGQRHVVDIWERFPRLSTGHKVDYDGLRPLLEKTAEVRIACREISSVGNRDHTLQEIEPTEVGHDLVFVVSKPSEEDRSLSNVLGDRAD